MAEDAGTFSSGGLLGADATGSLRCCAEPWASALKSKLGRMVLTICPSELRAIRTVEILQNFYRNARNFLARPVFSSLGPPFAALWGEMKLICWATLNH